MDYPPWLPKPETSNAGIVLALARYVYECWYRPEERRYQGEIYTFDNMCSSDLERIASVLVKTGFLRYIDDIGRRSVFNCSPAEFEELASATEAASVSEQEIVEAVLKLASGNYALNEELEFLADMLYDKS